MCSWCFDNIFVMLLCVRDILWMFWRYLGAYGSVIFWYKMSGNTCCWDVKINSNGRKNQWPVMNVSICWLFEHPNFNLISTVLIHWDFLFVIPSGVTPTLLTKLGASDLRGFVTKRKWKITCADWLRFLIPACFWRCCWCHMFTKYRNAALEFMKFEAAWLLNS